MSAVELSPGGADVAYKFDVGKYSDGVPPDGTPEWSASFWCASLSLSLPGGSTVTVDQVVTEIAEAIKAATGFVGVTVTKSVVDSTTFFDQHDGS